MYQRPVRLNNGGGELDGTVTTTELMNFSNLGEKVCNFRHFFKASKERFSRQLANNCPTCESTAEKYCIGGLCPLPPHVSKPSRHLSKHDENNEKLPC